MCISVPWKWVNATPDGIGGVRANVIYSNHMNVVSLLRIIIQDIPRDRIIIDVRVIVTEAILLRMPPLILNRAFLGTRGRPPIELEGRGETNFWAHFQNPNGLELGPGI